MGAFQSLNEMATFLPALRAEKMSPRLAQIRALLLLIVMSPELELKGSDHRRIPGLCCAWHLISTPKPAKADRQPGRAPAWPGMCTGPTLRRP